MHLRLNLQYCSRGSATAKPEECLSTMMAPACTTQRLGSCSNEAIGYEYVRNMPVSGFECSFQISDTSCAINFAGSRHMWQVVEDSYADDVARTYFSVRK